MCTNISQKLISAVYGIIENKDLENNLEVFWRNFKEPIEVSDDNELSYQAGAMDHLASILSEEDFLKLEKILKENK